MVVLVVWVAGAGCSWAAVAMVVRVRSRSWWMLLVVLVGLVAIPDSCRCSVPVVPVVSAVMALRAVVTVVLVVLAGVPGF
jgi:hypothetical protein